MDCIVTLRPAGVEDLPFLYAVYASTRLDELVPLHWDEATTTAFLTMQFNAQHEYYHAHFADADFDVILVDGQPAGRLYVNRRADEIRLIDVALLPAYRRRGIGTGLLRSLLSEAAAAGKPVRLHVEAMNPARRLYERLGFAAVAESGVYVLMEWAPGESVGA